MSGRSLRPLLLSDEDFGTLMENAWNSIGTSILATEMSHGIRTGGRYGRLESSALRAIFAFVFGPAADRSVSTYVLDVGSGIGNVVFESSHVFGFLSIGIECDKVRFDASVRLQTSLANLVGRTRAVCPVRLVFGDATDPAIVLPLLPSDSRGVWFVNNYGGVLGYRENTGKPSTDDFMCGLFANSRPGTKMVTLFPMYGLGLSREETIGRYKTPSTVPDVDKSFFDVVQHTLVGTLEQPSVSWSNQSVDVWIYTRLPQSAHGPSSNGPNDPRFVCMSCYATNDAVRVDTTTGKFLVTRHCDQCNLETHNTRPRN